MLHNFWTHREIGNSRCRVRTLRSLNKPLGASRLVHDCFCHHCRPSICSTARHAAPVNSLAATIIGETFVRSPKVIFGIMAAAFLVTGCHGFKTSVLVDNGPIAAAELRFDLCEVHFDDRPDNAELDKSWGSTARGILLNVMARKGIRISESSNNRLKCKLDIVNGSRGARIASAGLTGGGHITVELSLWGHGDAVLYSASTVGSLHGGSLGGDMSEFMKHVVRLAGNDLDRYLGASGAQQ
jgi:hypothetical protein